MDLQELERLYSLKEKGIITEEQFIQKKQQILGINKILNPPHVDFKFNFDMKFDKQKIKIISLYLVGGMLFIMNLLAVWFMVSSGYIYFSDVFDTKFQSYPSDIKASFVFLALAASVFVVLSDLIINKIIKVLSNLVGQKRFFKFIKYYVRFTLLFAVVLVSVVLVKLYCKGVL